MRCTIVIFTYEGEIPVIEETVKSIRLQFPKNPEHEFSIVLMDDARSPIPDVMASKLGVTIIRTTAHRAGNLRSYAWVKEQVTHMANLDADIVLKLDPDTLINDLRPFLEPFTQGYLGMVGFTGHPEAPQTHVIGPLYAVHVTGLRAMAEDVDAAWNTEWMDVICDYARTCLPCFSTFFPVPEDIVISLWFHHRAGLKILPSTSFKCFNWEDPEELPLAPVVLLGNPGPMVEGRLEKRAAIAEQFQKMIPLPKDPG